ncbi:hypothetical protein TNCV_2871351 [Trichonephila clavipes]|nr:hypothetical protein TNCV_2871351 [Trichonephila clavipes]
MNCSYEAMQSPSFQRRTANRFVCSRVDAVILAPDEDCVETSWKSAGGIDAGTPIGSAGAQMLVKLLELERLLELDHVSALLSLCCFSRFQSLFLR